MNCYANAKDVVYSKTKSYASSLVAILQRRYVSVAHKLRGHKNNGAYVNESEFLHRALCGLLE